jgi:hypothetical protein
MFVVVTAGLDPNSEVFPLLVLLSVDVTWPSRTRHGFNQKRALDARVRNFGLRVSPSLPVKGEIYPVINHLH